MITTCNAITFIDSNEVDQLLNRLNTQELLALIATDENPLEAVETEEGQRWDKDAIELAIQTVKARQPTAP